MFSIQEMLNKTEIQTHIKMVKKQLDAGSFHPSKGSLQTVESPALQAEILETLNSMPLQHIMKRSKEFLAKSGTTGISGAAYLIPDALHMRLMATSKQTDKVPLFAAEVVNGWKGGNLLVDIATRTEEGTLFKWTMHPQQSVSGAQSPMVTAKATQATLKPVQFTVTPAITNDLIEDNNFDIVAWHIDEAARNIGQYATDLALADLKTASDGDGTQCALTAGADTTTSATILEAVEEVGSEFHSPDTLICTHKAWSDAICVTASNAGCQYPPPPQGYDAKFHMLDTVFTNSKNLHAGVTSGKMTNCISLVLDRTRALLCGRKRWMQIEKYGDPVSDLSALTITNRQDCVTLYNDASCEITES